MPGLKDRAKTLLDLAESSLFYVRSPPLPMTEKAKKGLDREGVGILSEARDVFLTLSD